MTSSVGVAQAGSAGQQASSASTLSDFDACPEWDGPRQGWVFKHGESGTGYYRDKPPKRVHDIFVHLKQNMRYEVLRFNDGWHETDQDGSSTLHWAAMLGDIDLVKRALAEGLQVDVRSDNGQTPLFWAVTKGHVNVVKVLVENGADVLAKDSLGASPPVVAVQFKQATVLLYLLANPEFKANVLAVADNKGCGLVHWAAYVGDMAGLKILEYFKADFASARDLDGKTPLHRAVSQNFNKDVVEFLIDQKVNPYSKDKNGKSFWDVAVDQHGRPQVEVLLSKMFKARGIAPHGDDSSGDSMQFGDLELGDSNVKSSPSTKGKNDFEKLVRYGPAMFWLACVSMATFEYLVDIRTLSWSSRPYAAFLFEIGVPISVFLFLAVGTVNPGIIPPRPQQLAIEELIRAFETGSFACAPKLCSETWVIKPPRSKYCRETGRCIEEFDHFCGWLNCAIGKNNHRWFMILAIVEVATQLVYMFLGGAAAVELIPVGTSYTEWFVNLSTSYPLLVMMFAIQLFTVFLILNLVKFQLTLICMNYTCNEYLNADRYGYTEARTTGRHKLLPSPFHKGSVAANCLDFWWRRQRTVGVNLP